MKSRGIKKFVSFLLAIVMIFGVFVQNSHTFAEAVERVETKITSFKITDTSGSIPSGYILDK